MQIETERLIMRDFRADDWPEMVAYWADPRYQLYYPANPRFEETARGLVTASSLRRRNSHAAGGNWRSLSARTGS